MRRICLVLALVAAIAAAYELGRHNQHSQTANKSGRHVIHYVDPMHPTYTSDKPGIAPDCGMQLEPVFAEDAGSTSSSPPLSRLASGPVSIDGATQQLLGIRLAQVERSGGTRVIRAVGRVVPEDTRVFRINPGVDGFVRDTFQDSVGVAVKKDQKLATYYSPEFLSVASGFLAATQGVPGANGMDGSRTVPFPGAVAKQGVSSLKGYTDRLRNLGMGDVQIQRISENRQLPESIDIVAPADGFILSRNVSRGLHFERNMEFYRIADLSRVWVLAEVFEQDARYLRPGGAARIALKGQHRRWSARIAESLPQSEAGGGTVKLRLEVDNPGFILRPDMLADVELPINLPSAVTVPLNALVDSGDRARVYVEHGDGVFEPREVETGWRLGEQVEILRGVQPGERVVVAATFLVDSESRLKAPTSDATQVRVLAKPTAPPVRTAAATTVKDPNCGMPVDAAKATAAGNTLAYRDATYYFCSKQCKEAFQSASARVAAKRQGDDDD